MQTPQYNFKGFFYIRINRTGNIWLPRMWSNRLSGSYFLELSSEGDLTSIQFFSEEMRLAKAAGEMTLEANDNRETSEVSQLKCREVLLDSLPNLNLPLDWCKAAGIESPGELILAGKGNYLEFWAQAGFDAILKRVT